MILIPVMGIFIIIFFLDLPSDTLLWREIHNSGHTPLFGFMGLLLLALLNRLSPANRQNSFRNYLIACVASILTGGLVEIIQFWAPGEPDIYDWMRDIGGAISFLGFYSLISGAASLWQIGKFKSLKSIILGLSSIAIIAAATPLALWSGSYVYRNRIFPQICDFKSFWQSKFLFTRDAILKEPPDSFVNRFADDNLTQISFLPAQYPTLTIEEPYPDWHGYNLFHMEVYSPLDSTISLTVRIEDFHHNQEFNDRFNATYKIIPGLNSIDIPIEKIKMAPKTREMDLGQMRAIHLFAYDLRAEFSLYIGNIRLE